MLKKRTIELKFMETAEAPRLIKLENRLYYEAEVLLEDQDFPDRMVELGRINIDWNKPYSPRRLIPLSEPSSLRIVKDVTTGVSPEGQMPPFYFHEKGIFISFLERAVAKAREEKATHFTLSGLKYGYEHTSLVFARMRVSAIYQAFELQQSEQLSLFK